MKKFNKAVKNTNSLGERIRFFRQRIYKSQLDIENEAGFSSGTLSRIENNTTKPTTETLARIADILNLDTKEFAYLFEINLYTIENYNVKNNNLNINK